MWNKKWYNSKYWQGRFLKKLRHASTISANLHTPCRAPTMPLCKRLLKATTQHVMVCVNSHLPSLYGMWAVSPASVSSDYHADFHEGHDNVGERQGHGTACVNQPCIRIRPPGRNLNPRPPEYKLG